MINKLLQHDHIQFWKEIKHVKKVRSSVAATANNVTGSKNITYMWKQHFDSLLNSSVDTSKKSHVLNTVKKSDMSFVRFSIVDVLMPLSLLKMVNPLA